MNKGKVVEKVIILSRVSTLGQDLMQQTESVKRLVRLDGFSDEQIITIEDKESAVLLSEEERNGLNTLKKTISEENICCVYCYEISRISRKSEINYSIRDFLRDNHVQLKIVTPMITVFDKDWNISPEANLMYSLFSALAENEGYIRKARFARGKQRNKQLGKFNGGIKLFGYNINGEGYYIVNEDEANIVKRIYSEYCYEGKSCRDISKELYEEGIISQNYQRCRDNFVNRILKNEYYYGKSEKTYPKIISEKDFVIAKSIREKHVVKPRKCFENNIYFGHKLLYVEDTGRQLIVRKSDCSYTDEISKICLNMNITDSLLMYCSNYAYRQHSSGDYEKIKGSYKSDLAKCKRRLVNYDIKENKIKESIDRLEERIILGNISESKSKEIESKLKNELNNLSVLRRKDLEQITLLEKNLEAIQEESDSNLDVYMMSSDNEIKEFINKEIKFVKVKKIKRGHYYLNVCYKNMLIDGQIYEIESRKKLIKLYDKKVSDIKIIERFKR